MKPLLHAGAHGQLGNQQSELERVISVRERPPMSVGQRLKRMIPSPMRGPVTSLVQQAQLAKHLGRWLSILRARLPERGQIHVFYGHEHIPRPGEPTYGGIVKFQRMQELFPNAPRSFNILYMVSSRLPEDWLQLLWLARARRARVVWNQNGVAYPGWRGPDWEKTNRPLAKMLHAADYVFYQSRFCKLSADRFLGERRDGWEILCNAVDTTIFTPAEADPDPRHLVLLLGGSQYQYYRIDTAIRALALLARRRADVRLLVTGKLCWIPDERRALSLAQDLASDLQVADRVTFLGPYAQVAAPAIFRRAHVLLHTKYNDPCPGLVVEAMACGLPVVYSRSGGLPELVGEEAGVGVPAELSWERDHPPDAQALADAVLQVADRRQQYAAAARQRAVERFDLRPWLHRHREVFEAVLG